MKTILFDLTIQIMNSDGELHYLRIMKNATREDVRAFEDTLWTMGCTFDVHWHWFGVSLTVHLPALPPLELQSFLSKCREVLQITPDHWVEQVALPGNPDFWELFSKEEKQLVKLLFSNLTTNEIMESTGYSKDWLKRATSVIYGAIRIKFPLFKLANRNQFKKIGIQLGVNVPERCSKCKRVM